MVHSLGGWRGKGRGISRHERKCTKNEPMQLESRSQSGSPSRDDVVVEAVVEGGVEAAVEVVVELKL